MAELINWSKMLLAALTLSSSHFKMRKLLWSGKSIIEISFACPPPVASVTIGLETRSRRLLFSRFMFTKPLLPLLLEQPYHALT